MPRRPSSINYRRSTIRPLVPALLTWFAANARDLPWRRTRDPYAIWISEIMLQQTQVKTVLGYWVRWMTALPTIQALAQARSQTIHKLWEGLGYYTRVRNLQKAAQQIIAHHAGQFPRDFDAILELPGIGRYTAGAIASIAFNEPRPILDGNVIRVLTRVFGITGNPRDKTVNARLWQLAQELVENARLLSTSQDGRSSRRKEALELSVEKSQSLLTSAAPLPEHNARILSVNSPATGACSALNQSLMELGALICTPRQPKCPACPLRTQCAARRTNRVESLPNLAPHRSATPRHFAAFVIESRGRFLVRQRPADALNAHLWEFPNAEVTSLHFEDASASKTATGAPTHPAAAPFSPSPRDAGAGRGASRMPPDSLSKLHQIAQAELGFSPGPLQKLCTLKHSITRYRLTVTVFRAKLTSPSLPRALAGRWLTLPQLRRLPFTAAHRRILDQHLPQPRQRRHLCS